MPDEREKTPKDVERELADIEERSKTLEEELAQAEARRPPKPDHASDGGVI
jgi:hypothetical protein